jgi:hypothetical protein
MAEQILERLFRKAEKGKLPPEFSDWSLANKWGVTVAHVAAYSGTLPADIGRDVYKLTDKDGRTVAHDAARYGTLPADMDRDIYKHANKNGTTVAHFAAQYGTLPPDIDHDIFTLADKYGWTVAHSAARYGNLSPKFDQWDIVDGKGRTVAEVAADKYPPDSVLGASARQWLVENRAKTAENAPEDEESGPRP